MQEPSMPRVSTSEIAVGDVIQYRYEMTRDLSRPYKVSKLFRDHEGYKALLYPAIGGWNEHTILLADDEDYGELYIYLAPKP